MENAQDLSGKTLIVPIGGSTMVTLPLGVFTDDDYNLLLSTLALWKHRLVVPTQEKIRVISDVPFTAKEPEQVPVRILSDGMLRTPNGNGKHRETRPLVGPEERQEAKAKSIRSQVMELAPQMLGGITVARVIRDLGLTDCKKTQDSVSEALGSLLKKGKLNRVSMGLYEIPTKRQPEPEPAPMAVEPPTPPPAPKFEEIERKVQVQKLHARAETEAAKAVRRAVAVVNSETFTRDDITEAMKRDVGERMVATWTNSGGLSGTLLDLRNLGMLELHPTSKPGRAVYVKAKHFVPVAGEVSAQH